MPITFAVEEKSKYPSSRADWDGPFDAAMSLEAGKVLRIPVPEGPEAESFRSRVGTMFSNRLKRAKVKPQVRFRTWIKEEDDAVIVEKLELTGDAAGSPGGG